MEEKTLGILTKQLNNKQKIENMGPISKTHDCPIERILYARKPHQLLKYKRAIDPTKKNCDLSTSKGSSYS